MSTPVKKPAQPAATGRRPSTDLSTTSSAASRTSSKSPTPSSQPTSTGVGRSPSTRSPVSARAAARRPTAGRSNLSNSKVATADNSEEDDARAESAALIDDLKTRLQKAELASEEYQKQLEILQSRLDEALTDHAKLEESTHQKDGIIEVLAVDKRDLSRQIREVSQLHDAEKSSLLKEKEEQAAREEELQSIVQRLKETIAQKDMRMNVEGEGKLSRSCMPDHLIST